MQAYPQITSQSFDQMMVNHRDFLTYLDRFKTMLADQKGQTNLKYLLCRLDFNEYYQIKAIKQEEEKKRNEIRGRGGRGGGNGEFFDGEFEYGDEDEEEGDEDGDDDDEDDDDQEDDDDDDGDEYGGEDQNAHHMNSRAGYSISSGLNGSYQVPPQMTQYNNYTGHQGYG